MKQEYQKMQESLLPKQEKREEMWERIVTESGESRKRKRNSLFKTGMIGSAVAALLICVLFLPQIGLADHIRGIIQSAFVKGSDNVTKDVQNDLCSDKNEHVKMEISEMLSDGFCVYLGIRYRALDQEGKDFLFDEKWGSGKGVSAAEKQIFSLLYTQEFVTTHDQGWSADIEEIEELKKEDERYFVYLLFENGDNFSFDDEEISFKYAMPEAEGGFKKGKITIKSNLDRILYRVEKKDAAQGEHQPIYLSVSKLSFQLLMPGADSLKGKDGADDEDVKVVVTTKDGLERYDDASVNTPKDSFPMMKLIEDVENKGEYRILYGLFHEDNYEKLLASPSATIDHPDEIAALEIAGEQFHLIREE
ncbi:MAG: hypothetical protein J1E62_08160 [Lachnospiraceae bacterium]|nr:hypothetical protein [Lachnospiraceae bacterium]